MIILGKWLESRFAVLCDDVVSLVASYAVVSGICEKLFFMLLENRYQLSCSCIHSYRLH